MDHPVEKERPLEKARLHLHSRQGAEAGWTRTGFIDAWLL